MSEKALGEFINKINGSADLSKQVEGLISGQRDWAGFIALGRDNGFEFTHDELQANLDAIRSLGGGADGELSQADLEMAAGGAGISGPGKISGIGGVDIPTTESAIKWARCW